MKNYRTTLQKRIDVTHYIVWVAKYCKPALSDEVGLRLRDFVRENCRTHEIDILQGGGLATMCCYRACRTCRPAKAGIVYQGLKFAQAAGGIPSFAEIILESPPVGAWILRGFERNPDRRSRHGIHPTARGVEPADGGDNLHVSFS